MGEWPFCEGVCEEAKATQVNSSSCTSSDCCCRFRSQVVTLGDFISILLIFTTVVRTDVRHCSEPVDSPGCSSRIECTKLNSLLGLESLTIDSR